MFLIPGRLAPSREELELAARKSFAESDESDLARCMVLAELI